jgi:hypothetical protein
MRIRKMAPSEKFVVTFRLRQLAKRVIKGQFEYPVGRKAVGFSHGDFSLVVQALHHSVGNQF